MCISTEGRFTKQRNMNPDSSRKGLNVQYIKIEGRLTHGDVSRRIEGLPKIHYITCRCIDFKMISRYFTSHSFYCI